MSKQQMIFIGDNGRCTCWSHSGMCIRTTGRDISGQEALALSKDEAEEAGIKCEDCKGAGGTAKRDLLVQFMGRNYAAASLEDAARKVRGMIEAGDIGASECGSRFPVIDENTREAVGVISYNGKIREGV